VLVVLRSHARRTELTHASAVTKLNGTPLQTVCSGVAVERSDATHTHLDATHTNLDPADTAAAEEGGGRPGDSSIEGEGTQAGGSGGAGGDAGEEAVSSPAAAALGSPAVSAAVSASGLPRKGRKRGSQQNVRL
jgi:hypothetical protein